MRHAIAGQGLVPDHVGLAYDVWAPVQDGEGKVPDEVRASWLALLAQSGVPRGYAAAYQRWKTSLQSSDARAYEVELTSRLLLGHGNAAPTEVGLTVHHTWGVPIISGSALKGLLAHYVQIVFGPATSAQHPLDPDHAEMPRAPYQGVHWEGPRIAHGPGSVYRELFGAPPAQSDESVREEWLSPEQSDAVGALQGCVVFHDALLVPPTGKANAALFGTDVLTVHQKPYYDRQGESGWPNDHSDPTPIAFLTVLPGTRFLLALSGPPEWTQLAADLLKVALFEWGVGGKTAAGYGRVSNQWSEVVRAQARLPPSPLLEELRTFLANKHGTAKERLAALLTTWAPRLKSCAEQERAEAWLAIQKGIGDNAKTRDALAQLKELLLPPS